MSRIAVAVFLSAALPALVACNRPAPDAGRTDAPPAAWHLSCLSHASTIWA